MIKTVVLTGKEIKVQDLGGFNTVVHNLGDEVIYASKYPNVIMGADNVAEIPQGAAKLISTTNGTVYLLGTGKAELTGQDHDSVNFKAPSSFKGDDGVSNTFKEYVGEALGSINSALSAKADKSEIPATLPANGGNADMVNGHTVNADVPENAVFTDTVYSLPTATKTTLGGVKVGDNLSVTTDGTLSAPIYSNPNLLDNPDFKINQRGVGGTIKTAGYFVDRWKLTEGSVTIGNDGSLMLNGTIKQILENHVGTNVTVSYGANSTVETMVSEETVKDKLYTTVTLRTTSNVIISWAKLELGNTETPFVPPSPSAELAKCMYYYERRATWVHRASGIYSFAFAGIVFAAPKRVAPTVKLLKLWHDGNSASEQFFKDITTAKVSASPFDPLFSSTWAIIITVITEVIKSDDFMYQMLYEASADL